MPRVPPPGRTIKPASYLGRSPRQPLSGLLPLRDATRFPGIELILRVESVIRGKDGVTRTETRYFITSLRGDETSPERLLRLVRGHWSVENRLHFIKDRWWEEDRQWSIRPGLAERMAMMRDAAL